MSECKISDCENGVLDEWDTTELDGTHSTKIVWCPVCQPDQYEEIYYQNEMLELIQWLANGYDGVENDDLLANEFWHLSQTAKFLLLKIEGGEAKSDLADEQTTPRVCAFAEEVNALLAKIEGGEA